MNELIEVIEAEVRSPGWEPRVKDLMTSEPISLSEEHRLTDVRDLLKWKAFRHVPITNADGELVGLLTERDILSLTVSKLAHLGHAEADRLYSTIQVREIMGRKIKTATPDMPLSAAAETMLTHKFGCLPVVSGKKLVGILTEADFVKAFLSWRPSAMPGLPA